MFLNHALSFAQIMKVVKPYFMCACIDDEFEEDINRGSSFPRRSKFHVESIAPIEVFIPQSPEELQGRVVAFGFTVTGNRGKSSAPATIYNKDHKKEIAAHKQF
jgi:hypothetical protein